MIYSELYLKQKIKLPTVIGFLLVIFVTVVFARFFLGFAGPSKALLKTAKRIEIVNLSPEQAGIFWQTEGKESGWVVYGEKEGEENQIVSDEKDLNNIGQKRGQYKIHLATLKELEPGRKYFFKMVSDNNQIIVQPDGRSFTFTTPQSNINNTQNVSPAFGKVLKSNSVDPLINSYILLSIAGGYPLLTQIKSEGDGSWLIPLGLIYKKDSRSILTIADKDKIIIEIITSEGEVSTITTVKSKASPLPQTTVFVKDKNFSFEEEENVLSAATNPTNSTNNQIDIVYPKEGVLIPGRIPLIKGVGLPKTKIEITVNSKKTYSAVAISDINGNWSYLLPENLELGPHTIIIKTKDQNGKVITIQRNFTIIALQGNEGRVLGTATGEPTIIFTPSPQPTKITTPIPTLPNLTTTPPVSGSNFFGIIFSGLSLIIIGGGILLVF